MLSPEIAKYYELERTNGAYIISGSEGAAVASGSPAEKAGLKEGDIITKVNDVTLDASTSLVSELSQFAPDDSVKLTILRDGREQVVTVTLGRYQ